jgi:predicted GIY-YIG superfamily endonuclease
MSSIYALLNNGIIVYIGCSNNVNRRVKNHFIDKEKKFDSFAIIETFKSRSKALMFEKILIKTISMLSDNGLINKNHNDWLFPGQSKIKVVNIESLLKPF